MDTAVNLDTLRRRRDDVINELRTMHAAIGEANPTAEQMSRWEELDAEETRIAADIEDAQQAAERAARVAASRARWGSVQVAPTLEPAPVDAATVAPREARDQALKVLDRRDDTAHLTDAQRVKVESIVRTESDNLSGAKVGRMILATEHEHYRSAFRQYLSRGTAAVFSPDQARAVTAYDEMRAAMGISVDAQGGFGVPVNIKAA